jgi:peptidoglycan-associated lipoprotein
MPAATIRRLVLLALGVCAAAVTACKSPEVKPDAPPAPPPPAAAPTPEQKAAEYKAQGQKELTVALEKLGAVRVFFEFDSATLTKEASDALSAVGEVLSRHPELDVAIEGHADERGSSQYNLALGQRRAESVKKYLAQLGVTANQIKTVSFGAEKPLDPGHDEEAWKKNRRAEVQAVDAKTGKAVESVPASPPIQAPAGK